MSKTKLSNCCVIIKFKRRAVFNSLKNLKIKVVIKKPEYTNDTVYDDCYQHMNSAERYYYGYDSGWNADYEEDNYDDNEGLYGKFGDSWEDYWDSIYN